MNRDEPLTPEERELARLLGRRAEQAPPPALDAAILAAARAAVDAPAAGAVASADAPRARQARPRWPAVFGIAASMVFAIGIAWQLRRSRRRFRPVRPLLLRHRHRQKTLRLPVRPLTAVQPTALWRLPNQALRPQHPRPPLLPLPRHRPSLARPSRRRPRPLKRRPKLHDRWLRMRPPIPPLRPHRRRRQRRQQRRLRHRHPQPTLHRHRNSRRQSPGH